MKKAMRIAHTSNAMPSVVESMVQCNMRLREDWNKDMNMTARFRPMHSSFETLRHSGTSLRTPFNNFGSAANEQMTAIGYARTTRPVQIYSEFIQR